MQTSVSSFPAMEPALDHSEDAILVRPAGEASGLEERWQGAVRRRNGRRGYCGPKGAG